MDLRAINACFLFYTIVTEGSTRAVLKKSETLRGFVIARLIRFGS
jgi:hypothetical protein